jgi:hypothetical protein
VTLEEDVMKLDRRDFVRLGGVGAAGILGSSCNFIRSLFPPRSSNSLTVRIRGLCLVERLQNAVNVHLVDATLFDPMYPHVPYLSVLATDIDSSTTAPSIDDPYKSGRKVFDLKNKTVSLDVGLTGGPDLTANDDDIDENIPADDAHWKSVKLSARLSTLCGATRITGSSKFYGNVPIEHGRLEGMKPVSSIGLSTLWQFDRVQGGVPQKIVKQALTDTLACTIPIAGTTATFRLDGQTVVVKLSADVTVQNLPRPDVAGACKSTNPCVDHLAMLYAVVDKQFDPTANPMKDQKPPQTGADPDYCPPGSI